MTMTPEDVWRHKSDEELLDASRLLADFTPAGRQAIEAELERRVAAGLMAAPVGPDLVEPPVARDRPQPSSGNYVMRLWQGHVSLAVTYWAWGVLGSRLWRIPGVVAGRSQPAWLDLVVSVGSMAYLAFITVAIFRSAAQPQVKPLWANLARVSVSVAVAGAVVRTLFGR